MREQTLSKIKEKYELPSVTVGYIVKQDQTKSLWLDHVVQKT